MDGQIEIESEIGFLIMSRFFVVTVIFIVI